MALRTARALLRAQAQNTWNRAIRESGAAGPAAAVVLLVFAALVLAVPGFLVFRAGQALGVGLEDSSDPAGLLRWNAFQALFTTAFASFGAFRHRPAFRFADIGRFPVSASQMLLAELPAGLFEVFPILATGGILFSNLGFATVRRDLTLWLVLLTLQGITLMLVTMMILASARRLVVARRAWIVPLALAVGATGALRGAGGMRPLVREWGSAVVAWLPGSQGYAGLLETSSGDLAAGLVRIAAAMLATAALVAIAARLLQTEMTGEPAGSRWRRGSSGAPRFRHPAIAVAWLFLKQLLDSKACRVALFTPLLLAVSMAVPVWSVRQAVAGNRVIPEDLVTVAGWLEGVPMLSAFLFLIVAVDAQIWMNQFGWDRSGLRTLLLQPIRMRDILLGKTLGLAGFAVLQASLGILLLLWAFPPGWLQAFAAVAGSGSILVVAAAFGHFVSARFPRLVSPDSAGGVPFSLSWIPVGLLVVAGGVVAIANTIAAATLPGSEPLALLALLGILVLGYYLALPNIGRHVETEKERLLQMA